MDSRPKIVIGGGTGFLGSPLVDRLSAEGCEVALLSRNPRQENRRGVRVVIWDPRMTGGWSREVDGARAVINLAGEPMDARRWTARQKNRIVQSRVDATRAFVDAIRAAEKKPTVLINASGVGYYGDVPEGEVVEEQKAGEGFVAQTCARWEEEARKGEAPGVRVAMMRMGVVLGEDGGALAKMLLPFRLFVGGPLGNGAQWFPWVHREDAIGAMMHILHTPELSGPVNVVAPEPVTMRQFCLALGNVMHRPSWLRVPAPALRLILGEMAEMVLAGQKVLPRRLLARGYKFRYSNVLEALEAVIR